MIAIGIYIGVGDVAEDEAVAEGFTFEDGTLATDEDGNTLIPEE